MEYLLVILKNILSFIKILSLILPLINVCKSIINKLPPYSFERKIKNLRNKEKSYIESIDMKINSINRLHEIYTTPSVAIKYYGELILFSFLLLMFFFSISFLSFYISNNIFFQEALSKLNLNSQKIMPFIYFYGLFYAILFSIFSTFLLFMALTSADRISKIKKR
jgi:hypothetical protein